MNSATHAGLVQAYAIARQESRGNLLAQALSHIYAVGSLFG